MLINTRQKDLLRLYDEVARDLLSGTDLLNSIEKVFSLIASSAELISIRYYLKKNISDDIFRFAVISKSLNTPFSISVIREISQPISDFPDEIIAGPQEKYLYSSDELRHTLLAGCIDENETVWSFPVRAGTEIAGLVFLTADSASSDECAAELSHFAPVINFTGLFIQRELSVLREKNNLLSESDLKKNGLSSADGLLDNLFNHNPVPLILVGNQGLKILRYNCAVTDISESISGLVINASLKELLDYESSLVLEGFLENNEKRLLLLKNGRIRESGNKTLPVELEIRKLLSGDEGFLLVALIPHTYTDQLVVSNLESESRFASLRNVIPDLLLIMDKNGNYLDYFAPKDFPLIAAPENFIGKNYREVIQEPLLSQLDTLVNKVVLTGSEKFIEYSLDILGKKYFFELRCVLMSDGNILSLVRDITRIKEAESEKELLESRLRLILENFHGGLVILLNASLEIEFAMGKELIELGFMEKDLTGKSLSDFINKNRLVVHHTNFERALRGENVTYIEQLGERQYIFNIIPVENSPGTPDYYVCLLQNVSELLETQEKLKRSENLYRLLAENSKDVISLHEINGDYIFVSPSAESVTGFKPEELTGKNIRDFILPENLEKTRSIFDNMHEMIKLPQFIIEYQINVKSGSVKWIESVISFLAEEGEPHRFLAVSRNITERKSVEEKLRESESRYRYLVETMSEIIVRLDLNGTILFLNQAWRELTGYEVRLSSGRHFSEFTIQEDYRIITDFINNSRTEGVETQNFEMRLKSLRKGLRYYHVHITLTRNEIEKTTEILMTLTDVSERKKTLEQLKQSQEQLSSFLNSMNDVVYSIDLSERRFLLLNKAAEALYERPLEVLAGNPGFYRETVFARDYKTIQESEERLFAEGKLTSEYRIRTYAGNVKWIQDKVWLVKNEAGIPIRIEGIASEITERKRMERGILRSLEKEKELNELKTNFIATASHEFRTPLATILTSLGLLEHYIKSEQPGKISSHVNKMKNSVNLIKQLLDDLIVINRNQSGYIKLKLEQFSLTDVIDDTISLITDDEEEKRLFRTENNLSDQYIKSDIKLIQHILRNLIGNAYKYSGSRKPVRIKITEDEDNWIFEISDQGIGIPEEDLPRIFDHFVRGRNAGTVPGTGLGLHIVKLSVAALKGEINVTSKVGKGTKITVSIPKVIFV